MSRKDVHSWGEIRGAEIIEFNHLDYQNCLQFKIEGSRRFGKTKGIFTIYLETCCSEQKMEECGEIWVEHIDKPEWLAGMIIENIDFQSVGRLPYGTRYAIDQLFHLTITGRRTVGELGWDRIYGGCTFEIRHSSNEEGHAPAIQTVWYDQQELFGQRGEPIKWTPGRKKKKLSG